MSDFLANMGQAALRIAQFRKPDFIIGGANNPYLCRWFLREEGASGGLYLHQIVRDDDDRALHDHPWDASVYVIEGEYREVRADCPEGEVFGRDSYRHLAAETAHRLVITKGPVWTLCFIGKRRREWGFHCPQGWVRWQDFVATSDKGSVGQGCGGAA